MEPRSSLFGCSASQRNMLFLGNTDHLFRGARSSMGLEESSRRRPFSCQPEEMFGDEYDDEQSPEKKRRLSSEQVYMLEKTFEAENKLEPERKMELAKKLGLQPRQVAIWFQNRRARWKTKQLERDYDHLKSSYDSLLVDYDSVRKDNEKLRLEVASLNEKLRSRGGLPNQGHCADPATEKVDEGLSSVSAGSTVADEDSPRLVGSPPGSYYLSDGGHPHQLVDLINVVKSEDYGSSSDDGSCFCDVFGEQQQEPTGWWYWPWIS